MATDTLITYTWSIDQIFTTPPTGEHPNTVCNVNWKCVASIDEFSAELWGNTGFLNPGDPFIPYSELTETQLLQWIWVWNCNKESVEGILKLLIEEQNTGNIIKAQLPWGV